MGKTADSNISGQIRTGVSKGHFRFMAYMTLRLLALSIFIAELKFPLELIFSIRL